MDVEVIIEQLQERFKNTRRLLRTKEVAEFLSVKEKTVRKWCREGRLIAVKKGGEWRIPLKALQEFLLRDSNLT